jgi:Ca2+-binding RTX toxin-like protein
MGGYAPIAKAALAGEITYTQSTQAIQAYGFVVSQIAYAFSLGGSDFSSGSGATLAQAYQNYPQFSIVPRLPDGVWLQNSQMQIDVSGASSVTLTATGGDSLLAVVGNGTATLNGGSGSCDLLYGGGGPTRLNAGTGNDYMFGGSGPTTFADNTGNNYMHGGTSANSFLFAENNSGHDIIANFNVSTDQVRIGANLNGNGITSAAQLLAGATVNNGNTVLHLSQKDDITLFGISQPSNLINAILVA